MIVCPACGEENAERARFCQACATPLGAKAASREERRVVSVLFVDLVGFTSKSEQLDPEDVRAMLTAYYERARAEIERFGGTVEKFIGDAVMAVFGAPVAYGDDPERAVRAALAVRDAIAEMDATDPLLELQVRAAVNTGEAIVELGARPESGIAMVAGDVVNTAARLQSNAPVGQVLVGEETYASTRTVIEYRATDPISAKGKVEPVPAWIAIVPLVPAGERVFSEVPIVGRVAAGALSEALEHPEDTVRVDRMLLGPAREVFGLRVSGDSMIKAGINDGDYVFVKKQIEARKGDIVIALVGEEATCKYFYPESDRIRLVPANDALSDIVVSKQDWRSTQLLGVVVGLYRRMN